MAHGASQTQATATNTSRIHLRAVLEAGLGAGVVFLLLEYITGLLGAATALGPATFTLQTALNVDPAASSSGLVAPALLLHFMLSLLTTGVLGVIVHRWTRQYALVAGALYGAFLYSGNVVLFTVFQPELGLLNDTLMLVNYALYGLTAAWIYKRRQAA